MSSAFTWLDYSEAERRKMLDVIDLFRQKETRDELGISVVRDAFSDMLSPVPARSRRAPGTFCSYPGSTVLSSGEGLTPPKSPRRPARRRWPSPIP